MSIPRDTSEFALRSAEFGLYELDRTISHLRVGRWTREQVHVDSTRTRMMYFKLENQLGLERESQVAAEFMKRLYGVRGSGGSKPPVKEVSAPPALVISAEEAEKIADEMISSFSKNTTMKELLEGARFFAGAGSLSGAIPVRRSRTQIKRFEQY